MGGKNPFLGIAYIVVGGICIVLGALFTVTHLIKPRWVTLKCSKGILLNIFVTGNSETTLTSRGTMINRVRRPQPASHDMTLRDDRPFFFVFRLLGSSGSIERIGGPDALGRLTRPPVLAKYH